MSLTPNTRKWNSALAARLTNTIKDFNLHIKDLVDVVTLSLKQMRILGSIKENRNRVPTKLGRKFCMIYEKKFEITGTTMQPLSHSCLNQQI